MTDTVATTEALLKVVKRNGDTVPFDPSRIEVAITKAFLAVEGKGALQSQRIHAIMKNVILELTQGIAQGFRSRWPDGGIIHIEDIQDQVELALMRSEQFDVAKAYIVYRRERAKLRSGQKHSMTKTLEIVQADGKTKNLRMKQLLDWVYHLCQDLSDVDPALVVTDAFRNLFNGASVDEVYKALTMAARTLIEKDPNYSYLAARLLNELHKQKVFKTFDLEDELNQGIAEDLVYRHALQRYIPRAVELELLSEGMLDFDLEKLSQALKPEQDLLLTYLSMQTLYDRYFIHSAETRLELPQVFFMRVAMGLAIAEPEAIRNDKAIEFYELISSLDYMCSTPTLFNAGTRRSQLSSCFLTTVPDDLDGIYSAIRDNALLSKFAGGLGNDWTPVRAMGTHIKGTNGRSSGVVPFLNVADATAIAVNQGGKRKGAVCAYLETWHLDIEDFLELRKNTGDDRRRTHDMNTANWVPDLFMERVMTDGDWTLFSPSDVPDLHDAYGEDFRKLYESYEAKVDEGTLRGKRLKAVTLWRKMLSMLFETGHPWVTFKDPCNLRSPQQHCGVVHSSNLCTEITLNTSADEVAVCNLGSVNLANHVNASGLDVKKLEKTIKTAVRMLDNVIDINYYAIEQARNSNLRHRPVGMGLMGFQDALYKLGLPYGSEEAVDFADQSMEHISYYALRSSIELASERGAYESYPGSLWSQGILPIDSMDLLRKNRGEAYLQVNTDKTLDWENIRKLLAKHGIRNSNVMAIAPTATIANICGVSQSIEPTYQNLYVKSNLSGEFTMINPYLVRELKARDLWDDVMVNDLKFYDGSVQNVERIPQELKALFATAFEMDASYLVEAAARRQKWIDQAQSLNLYMKAPSGKKLDAMYKKAWLSGLKTTYYLRSLGASDTEKSTIHTGQLNAVKVCSIDDPDCEACQ